MLILIRKDNKIADEERHIMMLIGKSLGFDDRFCEDAIDEILINPYIASTPPKFSDKNLAYDFIQDGIKVALSDDDISDEEFEFLKETAIENEIGIDWLDNMVIKIRETGDDGLKADKLKIYEYL